MWTTLASSLLGSLTGLVGNWLKAKEKREERDHELKIKELEKQQRQQDHEHAMAEIDASIRVTEVQTEGQLLIEESKDFNKYVTQANKNILPSVVLERMLEGNIFQQIIGTFLAFIFAIVDVIRGLIRPILTAVSFGSLGYLAYLFSAQFGILDTADQYAILLVVIDAIVYVLTASVQYWFYDRQGARDFRKKH